MFDAFNRLEWLGRFEFVRRTSHAVGGFARLAAIPEGLHLAGNPLLRVLHFPALRALGASVLVENPRLRSLSFLQHVVHRYGDVYVGSHAMCCDETANLLSIGASRWLLLSAVVCFLL